MPSAMSSPMLPLGTVGTLSVRLAPSLRRMIAPLPYSFSMPATARSTALALFFGSSMAVPFVYWLSVQRTSGLCRGTLLAVRVVVLAACDDDAPKRRAEARPAASTGSSPDADGGESASADPPALAGDLGAD